jgi:hypothetical protein
LTVLHFNIWEKPKQAKIVVEQQKIAWAVDPAERQPERQPPAIKQL